MRALLAAAALFAAWLGPVSASAEPIVTATVETRVGRAVAPFYLEAIPVLESEITQAVSFIASVMVELSERWNVGVRGAAAPSLVAQPAGSYVDDKAFGTPQLFAERRLPIARPDGWRIESRVRGAIGVPVAGSGPAATLNRNRVVAVSAAIEGWREQELYVPGVLPLTLSIDLEAARDHFRGGGGLELPLLVRVDDAEIGDRAETRALAFAPNATIWGGVMAGESLLAAIAVHLAAQLPAPVAQPGGRVQTSLEPRIAIAIGRHVSLSANCLVALGGPLEGTFGVGLGLTLRR